MISVLISADSRYRIDRTFVREVVTNTLREQGITDNAEVSVAIVGSRKMIELSKTYMGDDLDHDVLSFPLQDPSSHERFANAPDEILRLGDIVVSYPEIIRQAAEDQVLVSEKLKFFIEHAIMHLLGEHHDDGIGE